MLMVAHIEEPATELLLHQSVVLENGSIVSSKRVTNAESTHFYGSFTTISQGFFSPNELSSAWSVMSYILPSTVQLTLKLDAAAAAAALHSRA